MTKVFDEGDERGLRKSNYLRLFMKLAGASLIFSLNASWLEPSCAKDVSGSQNGANGAPVNVPTQASNVGYTRLVFNEKFSNFQLMRDGAHYTGDYGVVWGNGLGFYKPSPAQLISWDGPGVLTLSSGDHSGGSITTHLRNWPHGNSTGSTLFHYGYFEASMRLVGEYAAPHNWASFWLFSAPWQEVSSKPAEWSEIDIFESGFYPSYGATVHDHHFDGSFYERPAQEPPYSQWYKFPKNVDLREWHTYGALWTPGRVEYYFDNELVQKSSSNAINDDQWCSIVLSVHGNAKSRAQFRWVHVFSDAKGK